jgi:hypothetical protein
LPAGWACPWAGFPVMVSLALTVILNLVLRGRGK